MVMVMVIWLYGYNMVTPYRCQLETSATFSIINTGQRRDHCQKQRDQQTEETTSSRCKHLLIPQGKGGKRECQVF